MPSSRTGFTNTMNRHVDHGPPTVTTGSKPFVVSSVNSKRYAPKERLPLPRVSRSIPAQPAKTERPSSPRKAMTGRVPLPRSSAGVVEKPGPRRLLVKPGPTVATDKVVKVQRQPTLHPVSTQTRRTLPVRTSVRKPSDIPKKPVEVGKDMVVGRQRSAGSAQTTVTKESPPKSSRVPSFHDQSSPVSVKVATKEMQPRIVKPPSIGPANKPKASSKVGVIGKTAGHVKAVNTKQPARKPDVGGAQGARGAPMESNRRQPEAKFAVVQLSQAVSSSPNMSSFPSQSWTIVVDVDTGVDTTNTALENAHSSNIESPKGSCALVEPVVLPINIPPSMAIETLQESLVGSCTVGKTNNPESESSTQVSDNFSHGGVYGTESMETRAKVIDCDQKLSATMVTDTIDHKARVTTHSAISDLARCLMSHPLRAAQAGTDAITLKTTSADASNPTNVLNTWKAIGPGRKSSTTMASDNTDHGGLAPVRSPLSDLSRCLMSHPLRAAQAGTNSVTLKTMCTNEANSAMTLTSRKVMDSDRESSTITVSDSTAHGTRAPVRSPISDLARCLMSHPCLRASRAGEDTLSLNATDTVNSVDTLVRAMDHEKMPASTTKVRETDGGTQATVHSAIGDLARCLRSHPHRRSSHSGTDTKVLKMAGTNAANTMDTRALSTRKSMDCDQKLSAITSTDTDHRTQATGHSAISDLAQCLMSHPRHASQGGTTNVSRIRMLFRPPIDENWKASNNPATQMEIEMLRARKMVAGGGVVDPRLDRFDSLSAMAVATKRWRSSPDRSILL